MSNTTSRWIRRSKSNTSPSRVIGTVPSMPFSIGDEPEIDTPSAHRLEHVDDRGQGLAIDSRVVRLRQ
jgi:hypothetical protein